MTTLQSLIDAANNLVSAIELIAGMAFILGMLAITLWRRDKYEGDQKDAFSGAMVLYFLSGFVTLSIGLSWADTFTGEGYCAIFIAAYEFLSGIVLILESKSSGLGWSRYKGYFSKIKEWF